MGFSKNIPKKKKNKREKKTNNLCHLNEFHNKTKQWLTKLKWNIVIKVFEEKQNKKENQSSR